MLALYATSTHAIAARGYTPNSFFALGLLVVVTTLGKGRRHGLLSVAVAAATIFGVSCLHRQGVIVREPAWEDIHVLCSDCAMSGLSVKQRRCSGVRARYSRGNMITAGLLSRGNRARD